MTTARWPHDTPDLLTKGPVFVVEVLIYWHFFGHQRHRRRVDPYRGADLHYTSRSRPRVKRGRPLGDLELRALALKAVRLVGGWKNARILLKGWAPDRGVGVKPATRAIRVRPDDDFTGL